ncbi:hypothetical protein LZ198_10290 [Myxococcus sp. K15C18031901]|uniref:hypothetical protein n=1 Tax=Myxococcus dinghuensis TaxID=2906761 RepID=UPI0020A7DD17|nr:hypothetical protein [Myxococcus dinghuensis]MCP3099259.1 hypothetical protein [Myxococcus dinghuensis]
MRPEPLPPEVPPRPRPPAAPGGLARPYWKDLLAMVALGCALALVVGWLASERRAVMSLEPAARAAVFRESWEGFQRLCVKTREPALVPRCREEARFLLLFPECQDTCRELARALR